MKEGEKKRLRNNLRAIVPLNVNREYTHLGDSTSDDFTTFLIVPENQNSFKYYNPSTSQETGISYTKKSNEQIFTLKKVKISHTLRVYSPKKSYKILRDCKLLGQMYWNYNVNQNMIIIGSSLEN